MTKARDLSNIVSSGVPNNLINLDANEIPSLDTAKITTGTFADARIPSLDASKIATGTIDDARISSAIANQKSAPYRNIIINGDMSIAQRGTSSTGITTSGYFTCDRWNVQTSIAGTWTQSQSTDVPTGQGFSNSFKMDCTTANASLSATSYLKVRHKIEGQNLQYIKKGTASAESLTLSFWVKSNKTGTYIVEFEDRDNSRHISQSYTIDTADTWEKKTLTYAGDTTGTLDNDNTDAINIAWYLLAGTNNTSGTLATSWQNIVTADRAVGQVNLADSTSNYINITGVQLEAGTTASDFEFLPYDVNLQRCLRYYNLIANDGTSYLAIAYNYSANTAIAVKDIYPMRTKPSLDATSGTNYYTFYRNSAGNNFNSLILDSYTTNSIAVFFNNAEISGTAGQAGTFTTANASSYVAFDAEL